MYNSGLRPERREPERDFRKFSLPMPANTWWSRSIIVVVAVCNDAAYLALIRKAPYHVTSLTDSHSELARLTVI